MTNNEHPVDEKSANKLANKKDNKKISNEVVSDVSEKENSALPPERAKAKTTPSKSHQQKKSAPLSSVVKSFRATLALLLSLVIIMLIVAAYFAWPLWQQQQANIGNTAAQSQQLQQNNQALLSQLNQQAQQLTQYQQDMTTLQKQQQANDAATQQRLDAQALRLSALTGRNRDNWMIEEARYLLRLASQRQLTGSDVVGVIGLLNSADELLKEIDRPDIFPVRSAIRKDIVALKTAPSVDREGLYLTLSALQQQITDLPSVPLRSTLLVAKEQSSIATEEAGSLWENIWQRIVTAFSHLDQYIKITHHADDVVTTAAIEAEKTIAMERLPLVLEQAQLSLIREDTIIYQRSLEYAIALLEKNYQHFPEKKSLVEQIRLLRNQKIKVTLPNLSASLVRLNEYIAEQQKIVEGVTPLTSVDATKEIKVSPEVKAQESDTSSSAAKQNTAKEKAL